MVMEICLKNFKIWKDKNLRISNKGVILLSGKSGRGKSSILDSIAFCLYDMGRNLKTYGQKDLSVTISFDNFTIKRKKNPNLLQVFVKENEEEKVYENELAQQFIKNTFGDFFKEIGYISQNSFSTFIYLNPADKLEFIEKVIFKDENIQQIKDKCKYELKELNNSLTSTSSKINYISELLLTQTNPEEVIFPLKKIKGISETELMDNLYIKKKNTEVIEKRVSLKLRDIEDKIKKIIVYNRDKDIVDIKINQKTKELDEIKEELQKFSDTNENEDEIKDIISSYKKYNEYVKLEEKLLDLRTKYDELIASETKEKDEKIKLLESKLNKTEDGENCDYTIEEAQDSISELKKYFTDMEKLEKLESEKGVIINQFNKQPNKYSSLEEYYKDITDNIEKNKTQLESKEKEVKELKLYINVVKCPHCNGGLRIQHDKLIKEISLKEGLEDIPSLITKLSKEIKHISDTLTDLVKVQIRLSKSIEKVRELDENISEIKSSYEEIRKSEEIEEDISYLEGYVRWNKQLQTQISELKTSKESKISLSYKTKISDTEKDIGKYSKFGITQVSEEEYLAANNTLQNINDRNKKKNELSVKLSKTEKEFSKLEEDLESINKNNPKESVKNLENKKIEIETIREENLVKKEKIEGKIKEVEKYKNYIKERDNYDKFLKDLEDMKKREKNLKEDIKNLNIFRDKIIEAETMTISNFIDTLSTHVNTYLERFFKDDPVFINIQTSKMTNTIKHGIHITIESKGNECNLEHLSGGERDRVSLAFTLALSEMFNNKILLLDECISSLDHETSSHVINGLKDNYKNNLVIVVAHQVNEGLFDDIIKV